MKRSAQLAALALVALAVMGSKDPPPRYVEDGEVSFTGDGGTGHDATLIPTGRANGFWVYHGTPEFGKDSLTVYSVYVADGDTAADYQMATSYDRPIYETPVFPARIDSIRIDGRDSTVAAENYWFTLVKF